MLVLMHMLVLVIVLVLMLMLPRYHSEGHLTKEWGEVTREMLDISTAAARATTYVVKLKESWQHLLRDRASRTLTYNDEQFHILEKIKMTETIRMIVALLVSECTPSVTSRTDALADWYKMASTIYLQTEILYKDLSVYQVHGRKDGLT